MKKNIVNLLLLFLWLALGSMPAFAAADSLRLGNSSDKRIGYEDSGDDGRCGAATLLSETITELCKGSQITDLAFIIGQNGATDLTLFITTDLNKDTYDYEQLVESYTAGRWNSVALDKPFTLTGEALYIGYKLTAQGRPVMITTFYQKGEEFIWRNGEWQRYEEGYAVAVYAIAKGENLPRNYATLTSTKMSKYADSQTPLVLTAQVQNNGVDTIKSLQLTYTDNGIPAGTIEVKDLSIATRAKKTITAELPLLAIGDHELQFTLATLNGKPNQDTSEQISSGNYQVICRDDFVDRNVLIEMFSTEPCPECPAGHRNVEEAIEENVHRGRVNMITHHAAFYSDKYTIDASLEYEWFYGSHQLSAPSVMYDRSSFSDSYPHLVEEGIPVVKKTTKTYVTQLLDEALKVPAFATVELAVEEMTPNRELTICVKGKELLPTQENPRLFVFLTEDSLFSTNQSGTGGEYIHQTVARQCLSETWGDEISLKEGYEKQYTTVIPDTLDAKNMKVVAFVANVDKENRLNCQVYNSASQKIPLSAAGVVSEMKDPKLSAVVQGDELILSTLCSKVSIYTLEGVCRLTEQNCRKVSLQSLDDGLYIVVLTTPQGDVVTQKMRVLYIK